MIRIEDKKDCCGCSACVQICPKACIRMSPDEEGFLYPSVDEGACIGCGLCEKVCPVINKGDERVPAAVYAVKNNDDAVRMKSSSGGVFSVLATRILEEGGVVFGARFDKEWNVVHDYIETVQDLHLFQGSRYVQSVIGDTYLKARDFLQNGRKVLFTGTACQIAGLKRFLRKDYADLVTVDVVCHGVPSPMVWRAYLTDIAVSGKIDGVSSLDDIGGVSFRSKVSGWKTYSMEISGKTGGRYSEVYSRNLYMMGFLSNVYLRPSCYDCPSKRGRCTSDLSLGDYWGVENHHPDFADNMGVGVMISYNDSALLPVLMQECRLIRSDYADAVKGNPCIERSVAEPRGRKDFWNEFRTDGLDAINRIVRRNAPGVLERIVNKIKRILSF